MKRRGAYQGHSLLAGCVLGALLAGSLGGAPRLRAANPKAAARRARAGQWPSYLGPNGNFSESSGVELLDDLTKARLLWTSDEKRIGHGKAVSWYGRNDSMYGDLPPGGTASLIVAGGLVIASYQVPSGDVWDAMVEKLHKDQGRRFQKHKWLISADDVVLAVDAATGKTRWKRVFAGKGMNHGGGKRMRWGPTPTAADGRAFVIGSTGRLYALDLAGGKLLWEGNIGPMQEQLGKIKAQNLSHRRSRQGHLLSGPLVIDGVLAVPAGSDLLGVDPGSGKMLWQLKGALSGFNMPCPARVKGQPRIACVNRTGQLRLVRPKTGEVLWTVALRCEHLTQPVATDEHLLVFEPNPAYSGGRKAQVNRYGVLAAYRLDESRPRRAWALPGRYIHELHLDGGPSCRVIPRDGLVYYLNWTCHPRRERRFLILREKDGSVLADHKVEHDQFYLWGSRLVLVRDNQHESLRPAVYQAASPDPAKFALLGRPWKPRAFAAGRIGTCGYELPMYDAFADGLMFCRTGNGDILCWDLRKAARARLPGPR
jgi:outer membrane protein assembly factor BamB